MQDHAPFNGSTATIIYKLARLEVITENTQHTARETQSEVRALSDRIDTLERKGLPPIIGDLLPYITGLAALALALTGRWAELGQLLRG